LSKRFPAHHGNASGSKLDDARSAAGVRSEPDIQQGANRSINRSEETARAVSDCPLTICDADA
jgi:hypothetical protein